MGSRQEATRSSHRRWRRLGAAVVATSIFPMANAQSCVSLAGSTTCPAFGKASIATTNNPVAGQYPFLNSITSAKEFDQQMMSFVQQDYVQNQYGVLLGCNNVTLSNGTDYYARFTLSKLCNAIIQNSISACGLTAEQAPPLCADTCAQQATSEEEIVVNKNLCGTPGANYVSQIRADFTYCAIPASSLSGSCITGEENEPTECGFNQNLQGLCSYCATSSPNATDSCCLASNVNKRCVGVHLPTVTAPPLSLTASSTSSPSSAATGAPANSSSNSGLSGGAIAGIVVGSIVGAALLLGLLVLACICVRRRRDSEQTNPFTRRSQGHTGFTPDPFDDKNEPPPGGRVARMTALEGSSSDGRAGLDPMLAAEKRRYGGHSDSDPYGESPGSGGVPPTTRRQGSLSSSSALGAAAGATGEETTSPSNGGGQYSSPGDWNSGQSEQLTSFKDYYSSGEIHPHDKVSVLWDYQPRATDEFELARGDMLRVMGIWDDGWATGILISDRADEYDGKHKEQRDSGISQTEGRKSPLESGDVKAFPLVCVCLPEHWKKTVEGDGSTESTTSPPPQLGNHGNNTHHGQGQGPFSQF